MKTQKQPNKAKYFKYQFTKTMLGLAIVVLLLCGVGIGISVYRLCEFGIGGFIEVLQSPLLILISGACIVIVVALLIKSQYVVDEKYFTTQFGFITSKYPVKDITKMELNTDERKLTLYVGETFSVLSLAEKWQDEFIAAIREVNPNIEFSFTLADKPDSQE